MAIPKSRCRPQSRHRCSPVGRRVICWQPTRVSKPDWDALLDNVEDVHVEAGRETRRVGGLLEEAALSCHLLQTYCRIRAVSSAMSATALETQQRAHRSPAARVFASAEEVAIGSSSSLPPSSELARWPWTSPRARRSRGRGEGSRHTDSGRQRLVRKLPGYCVGGR